MRLLIVEDDDAIAAPLVRAMQRESYEVDRVAAGRPAIDHVAGGGVDLVLLDLGLPDMDGLDVCRTLRTAGYDGGIVILTARAGELDRVVGLDVGADDYLAKPFSLSELLARVRALLRRAHRDPAAADAAPRPAYGRRSTDHAAAEPWDGVERRGVGRASAAGAGATGAGATGAVAGGGPGSSAAPGPAGVPMQEGAGLRVDRAARRAWAGPDELPLTAKEFDVLALLDDRRGAVVTRETLMSEVWDENWFGSTKTLDATVGRLRQKLQEADAPVVLGNVRGVGFRLEDAAGHA